MNRQSNEGYYSLRSGMTIYPSQDKVISQTLTDLAQKTPANFVLLTDVTGQVISVRGEQSNLDLVALGSLVAGDLAASQEIARLTGEYQDYQMVLREGQTTHTFILEAGRHLALLVQVSNDVPLGWARMVIKSTARQLADFIARPPEELEQLQVEQPGQVLGGEEIPDLFSEALDDLWLE